MKILVPTKRVPDTDLKIVVAEDGSRIETEHLTYVINPFDAIALEEAVRISERAETGVDVVAVSIGSEDCEAELRTALAMGAGRAVRVAREDAIDPWNVARILSALVDRLEPDMVLMGKQAVDDDANQTGQMLAALLDWPQATFVSQIELLERQVRVRREVDMGLETMRLDLPAVITVDLRLNEPRYASLAGIMRARKKSIDVVAGSDLVAESPLRVHVVALASSASQRRCQRLHSVDELAETIRRQDAEVAGTS